jgi:hypothetical protein
MFPVAQDHGSSISFVAPGTTAAIVRVGLATNIVVGIVAWATATFAVKKERCGIFMMTIEALLNNKRR